MAMMQRDAVIAGVYQTKQGDLSHSTQSQVWWEAVQGACADAGISLGEIDGLIGSAPEGAGIREQLPAATLGYDLLGKPMRFHAHSSIGASAGASNINLAHYAVSSGQADVVVVATASGGVHEGYNSADRDSAVAAMAKLSGPYEYIYGTTRVSDYAILAMRYFHEYGATSEQLAEVAVAQRHGATLHPLSFQGHRGDITVDDVMASRMISDPLRMLDCCAINQGGGAYIVTTAERAKQSATKPAVALLGYGEGHSHIDPNAVPNLATFDAPRIAADTAFAQAGITRDDIDLTAIGDHFTINVLLGLEGSGFFQPGEAARFAAQGGLGLQGSLPTNTAGGFLSFSHAAMCGLFSLVEVVDQLRGDAGERQVPGAQYGFVNGVGGAMQNNFAAILGRV